jgi:hypothetical protein
VLFRDLLCSGVLESAPIEATSHSFPTPKKVQILYYSTVLIMGEISVEEAPFPLTEVDKWVLSQTDEEFKCHDWEDLKTIIGRLVFSPSCFGTLLYETT